MQRTDDALVRIAGATTIVNAANGLSLNSAMSGSYLPRVRAAREAEALSADRKTNPRCTGNRKPATSQQLLNGDRQLPHSLAGCVIHGICDCRRDGYRSEFA